ncbi:MULTISPECIES: ribonuclease R [Pseudoalteromonas]|uniref:ribonuclease R n=1 Tax=Pseudoalteromonas TaxID=53246 RepID=UPI000C5B0CBC|nr:MULTISPECIES: ribonuclease R [Pseudoalteromonas]MAY58212.1 ribonuclease R [Pseudoalteromonas sp.]MDN3408053.1 ribonuclease R [Pseudoalteromonas sp. APC 3894]MDN3415693.1 ribonuclease R [Pseudoalteromonas sp. APC 3227]MDN3419391.1 ribonuclease R [Pseudoalteromonas sp. APC 3895]MDN3422760.1 ribonuclease R [Pseudoalteromonas sp. APC 3896]|tara:strand:+ start:7539 stop:9998 length:2460 start_codon:yes stop_codon:yes gene_type:complete
MSNQDPNLSREQEKYENPVPSREFILTHLQERSKPANYAQLCEELAVNDEERQIAFKRRLRAMERDGQLYFNKFKCYALIDEAGLTKGKVVGHRDGFGFLEVEGESKDWFIAKHQMNMVLHGDIVLAKGTKRGSGSKCDARIIKVLTNERAPIVGRYFVEHGIAVVVAEDPRITQDIIILPGNEKGARHNQMVQVQITQNPSRNMNAVGKVIDVLGEHLAPGMEIEVALRNHDIPHVWPEEVEQQVAHLGEFVEEADKQGRVDLRGLPLVTIDGEDARDFDDAVYCEPKKSGGWRLWVAIADVSHYVGMNTPLNKEAIERGNSVYFPEQVIPMLPKVLSNGLCSLNPEVDRLCMVAEMTVSQEGKLSGYKFYEAVMNSHARLTYTKVNAILQNDEKLRKEYAAVVPHLTDLQQMYMALKAARQERGAIEFETLETRFVFNAQRKIESIVPVIRNDAHKLIEECMILANVSAAKLLEKHEASALYRVHDEPDSEKLGNFTQFLTELGIESTLSDEPTPKEITHVLARLGDRPEAELIQTMLLRSMKQAVYQPDNIGHFGLALSAYAHFTSPIRRYPDLVVHRAIKAVLKAQGQQTSGEYAYSDDEVDQLGEQCSTTERRADDATREVADWLKCEYMQDHVGMEFNGVISSVTNFGLFIRLDDLQIDGLIHVTNLGDEYFQHDAAKHCLVGEHTHTVYRLGDKVTVQVASVSLDDRRINLTLIGDVAQDRYARRRAPKKNAPTSVRSQLKAGKIPGKKSASDDKKPKASKKPAAKGKSASKSKVKADDTTAKKKTKKKAVKKPKRPGKNARKRSSPGANNS